MLENEIETAGRSGCAKVLDAFVLVVNVAFLGLTVYAASNGVDLFSLSFFGLACIICEPLIIGVSIFKLKYLKKVKLKTIHRVAITLLYIFNLAVAIPFWSFFLILGWFHDKEIDNPKRYSQDMFCLEFREFIQEEIPENAQNVKFHYELSNFPIYTEAFLQYSLPQKEYFAIKQNVVAKYDSGKQSKFFEGAYDVDIGLKDSDDISTYSYSFISFCDEQYMIRFVDAYSQESIEPYFKTVAKKSD